MGSPTGWRPRWFGAMRVRILAVVVLLLLAASAGSVILLRSALLDRLDEEVAERLEREAEEFRLLRTGNDPTTGEPFGDDVRAVFDTYFAREIPDEGESLLAFVDGRIYQSRRAQDAFDPDAVSDATRDGSAVVTVADSGPGVDPADAPRIFTRFSRGRAADPSTGAGMGLAIVLSIAEAHGGTAQLVAGAGPGARFEILLPLAGTALPPAPVLGRARGGG